MGFKNLNAQFKHIGETTTKDQASGSSSGRTGERNKEPGRSAQTKQN